MKKALGAMTLVFPAPVWVIGTYDKEGKPNVMTAAWGGVCCSRPPCVGVSLREATYTHGNIEARKAFTVNFPSATHVEEADYFGIVSGKKQDKLAAAGLTPVKSDIVDAPYIKEFPVVLECKVIHSVEIGSHTQFIGEIMDIKADEATLDDNGLPDIEKVKPIIYSPAGRTYHTIGDNLGEAFSPGLKFNR